MKDAEIRAYKSTANFLSKFEESVDRHKHDKNLDKEQRVYFKTELVSGNENNMQ